MKGKRGFSVETQQLNQEQRRGKRYPNLEGLEKYITFFAPDRKNKSKKPPKKNRHAGGAGGDTARSAARLYFDTRCLDPNTLQGLALINRKVERGYIIIYSAEERTRDRNEENAKKWLNKILQDAKEAYEKWKNQENWNKGLGKKPAKVKNKEKEAGKRNKYRNQKDNH